MAESIKPPEMFSNTPAMGGMFKNPQNGQITNKAAALQGFKEKKDAEYDRIYAHEAKHKSAGGGQAGPIVIEMDANGVPTGGHVEVQIPTAINQANPDETLEMARIAYESATAPGSDMSDADKGVASRASSIMSLAQTEMNNIPNMLQGNQKAAGLGNKLDFSA